VVNVAARLTAMARTMPEAVAIAEWARNRAVENTRTIGSRRYRTRSFAELDADTTAIAAGLTDLGVEPGTKIALLVRPGIDFIALVFALLKAGAVQILIDPGMGIKNVLRALGNVRPQGFIAGPTVHAVRALMGNRFPEARFNITVGERSWWGATSLADVRRRGCRISNFQPAETRAHSPAAIIFTSGSTGPAKGVLYRHGNFDRQASEIRDFYDIAQGEIDVPCFPLFGLFNAAMGVTSVIPNIDASRPAKVDPLEVITPINDWRATQAFASPAVWNRVGRYCAENKIRLPSLRRVLSAGAPVAAHTLRSMTACIHPHGAMHTPYGATEALPVASISSAEVLSETIAQTEQGAGVCVGKRFAGIDWRVIRIEDGQIPTIHDATVLPRGEIGELIVCGPVVTTEYVTRTEANASAKIRDDSGEVAGFWHRMGDVGYLDSQGRFWFCGRMSQRVPIGVGPHSGHAMFTIPCEAIFNRHPAVFRSALVGVGTSAQRRPVMVVEPHADRRPRTRRQRRQLIAELQSLAQTAEHTVAIKDFLIRKSLPVDVRHNVKINREYLTGWAARKLRAQKP
jgi:olefin beta-lactone synthetase